MNFENLFVEKYRPKTLDDIILSKENREFFEGLIKQEQIAIPHMLFCGPAGTGKTSLAKIIVNDILKCQYLYINGSDQNSVDVVRGQVKSFVETKSIDGNKKVVIYDEFDGVQGISGNGASAQQALRNMIEEYSPYVRFIFTANYINKIIEPILSRVQTFYLQPEYSDYAKRCLTILKSENIKLLPEQKDNFLKLLKDSYPDLRKALNSIQKFTVNNEFKLFEKDLTSEITNIINTTYKMLVDNDTFYEIRKYIIKNEKKFNNDYQKMLKMFFDFIFENIDLDIIKKKQILLIISDSLYNHEIVSDKEINFTATLLKIDKILH